jgi:cellobiose transport system substrate-binding protein
MISTEETIYYDESGEPVWDSNPAVRKAFDTAAQAGQDGLTAKLAQFSPEWNTAFASGAFATIACPAWMLGYIKGQAGDAAAGTWDVVALPGGVGGNWGGSYLAVPGESEQKEEATKLVAWLTAPEQQEKIFTDLGSFPSNTPRPSAASATSRTSTSWTPPSARSSVPRRRPRRCRSSASTTGSTARS